MPTMIACEKCARNYPHMPRECASVCPQTDLEHADMARQDFDGSYIGYSSLTGYHLATCRYCGKRFEVDSSG